MVGIGRFMPSLQCKNALFYRPIKHNPGSRKHTHSKSFGVRFGVHGCCLAREMAHAYRLPCAGMFRVVDAT